MTYTTIPHPITTRIFWPLLVTVAVTAILTVGCAAPPHRADSPIQSNRQTAGADTLHKAYLLQLSQEWSSAWDHYRNKNYRNAIPPFWKVVELDTIQRFKNVYTLLSDAYAQLNKPDSAELVMALGIQEYPDNAHMHRTFAFYLARRVNVEAAIREYEITVKIDSTRKDDWKVLGQLYVKASRIDDAISAYETVIRLDRADQESHQVLSSLYRTRGNEQAAINQMEAVKKLDPDNAENLFRLGKAYFEQANYGQAIVNFQLLLKVTPQNLVGLEYLGASQQNNREINNALATYQKLLTLQPNNKKVMTDVAACYIELGKFQTAKNFTDKALTIDSTYGLAHIVRGEVFEAAAEACITRLGKRIPEFDDKLVFEMAYKEYKKAALDSQFQDLANERLNNIQDFIPTKEDLFFNKGKTRPVDACYDWIFQLQ